MPNIITTMQQFNYSPDLEGVCFGISAMSAQAAFRQGNVVFANRIEFIQNCSAEQIETIKNSSKNNGNNIGFARKLELLALFDGISMYQGATSVNADFKSIVPSSPNIKDTIKLIKSATLNHDSKFIYPEIKASFANAYTFEEFLNFIVLVKRYLGKQPFSIMIRHSPINHVTQLSFDGKNWLSANHDRVVLGEDNPMDVNKVASNVFLPERYGSTNHMAALFNLLLPEDCDVDLAPLKVCDFSPKNVTASFNKEMLSRILESYLKVHCYAAYLDILHKITSFKLTEKEIIALIEAKRKDGTTAMHLAAGTDELNVLNQMLKIMDDSGLPLATKFSIINRKNVQGLSALYYAAQAGNISIVKLLLDKGLAVKDKTLQADFIHAGESALFAAAIKGHEAVVKMLLKAIFSIKDKRLQIKLALANNTPAKDVPILLIPAQNGYDGVVSALIDAISPMKDECALFDFLSARTANTTALFMAAQQGHEQIVKKLLKAISVIKNENLKAEFIRTNPQTSCERHALFIAAKNGHLGVVRELIKAILAIKDKVTQRELLLARINIGIPALSAAAQNGHAEVVGELVHAIFCLHDKAAKFELLNATDNNGRSALFWAVNNSHANVVKALIAGIETIKDKEAQIKLLTATDKSGNSVLFAAEQIGNKSILKMLRTALENENMRYAEKNYFTSCSFLKARKS